jgi:hypothetical protein
MTNSKTTLLAFLVDLIATAANQISFALQKTAHMDQERNAQTGSSTENTIQKNLFCSMKGLCGFFLMIVGVVGNFASLPFLDMTLVACNSSFAIMINIFISSKYLGEKFVAKYDLTAMSLVTMGTLVIIMLSNKE